MLRLLVRPLGVVEVEADEIDIPAYTDLPGQSPAYYPFQITQTLPLPDELHTEMRKADVDRKLIPPGESGLRS